MRIRLSIFNRILLASLAPMILISTIVIIHVNLIVYDSNRNLAEKAAIQTTREISSKIEIWFKNIYESLAMQSVILAKISSNLKPETRRDAREFLSTVMRTNASIDCGWFVFEPSYFTEHDFFSLALIKKGGRLKELTPLTQRLDFRHPEDIPWYSKPFDTGEPYIEYLIQHDYLDGDEKQYIGFISYPIKRGEYVIGVVGIDIFYRRAFSFITSSELERDKKIFVLTGEGQIVYATDKRYEGMNIADLPFAARDRETLREALASENFPIFDAESPFFKAKSYFFLSRPTGLEANRPLFILTDTPASVFYQAADDVLRLIALSSLVWLAALIGCVFFATRGVVAPINQLIKRADLIANGKLDGMSDEAEIDRNAQPLDEVDKLRLSLMKMLNQLVRAHKLEIASVEMEVEKKKLEQEALVKDRFFANISHEIRSPMNAILGMAELLAKERLDEKAAMYARDIKSASETLLQIINDILDMSRIEAGELKLGQIHYDFNRVLDSVYSLCFFLAKAKKLDFRFEKAADLPDCLFGDDVRLRQILFNVVTNAVKFTHNGFVKLVTSVDGDMLRFNVIDSGIGIRREDMDYLFEPFKQFDSHKNQNLKGTGLGLSICRSLVGLMNGHIEVTSVYGEGTEVRIGIPLVEGNPELIKQDSSDKEIHFKSTAKVLIVDDMAINLDIARGLISTYGVSCETALSGAEAIEKVQADEYDIVFMDHMMPEMDGIETTKAIRDLGGRFAKIAIVALTANAVIGTKDMFLSSGMNDFLPKPIEMRMLQSILTKWIPKEKRSPEDLRAILQNNGGPAGEAASGADLWERLKNVSGLDFKLGLSRMADQKDRYAAILAKLCEIIPGEAEKLSDALNRGDLKRFTIAIHAIKGSLANIGAMELSERAASLEKAGKENNQAFCEEDLPLFLNAFFELRDRLATALDEADPRGDSVVRRGQDKQLYSGLRQLYASLANYNYDKSYKMLNILKGFDFGEERNRCIANIGELLDLFNYEAAMEFILTRFPSL
ncbi:MAG: response regulator [Planctomycetota bacterium]|nr:response regulator [Planctomycetota bacterium]